MCGIIGQLKFRGDLSSEGILSRSLSALRHRGPDAHDCHTEHPVALGHCRLAIIDLESGRQPMSNEDGRVWIVYNGELYNYRELRDELVARRHTFRTESDTEVVIHAWEEWGPQSVERFRGMFSFAIADWNNRKLFLARDHLGIKPLYYSFTENGLAFASELQALTQLPEVKISVDPVALNEYLRLQYIPAPRTIYRGVNKLPTAHRMVISFEGKTIGPERYWRLQFQPVHGRSEADWVAALEEVLWDSVRAHLVADVPFGAFLSGGLDSTAIVRFMSEELPQPVRTFAIGFDDEHFSELDYARIVARKWGTDHHEEIVRPKALEILPDLVRHFGEPFGDISAVPTYYVSRLARRFVPMVLSGDGGDEALAGYARYQGWKRRLQPYFPQRAFWKRLARPLAQRLWPKCFQPDGRVPRATAELWLDWIQSMGREDRQSLWRQEFHGLLAESISAFDGVCAAANGCPPESLAQYLDYHTYLPDDILTKVDITSMMHSLEVRTPFVDVRVAEFAATIPFDVSLQVCPNGLWSGKRLLKQILSRDFDRTFLNRPKSGFGVPLEHWFAVGTSARHEAERRLTSPGAHLGEFFEPIAVQRLFQKSDVNGRESVRSIWQLLFLEEWLDQGQRNASTTITFRPRPPAVSV
jgi:asparagine synthase (glutamine-hydrolysing)